MELGSVVWFSSREHPFVVGERHCLDLGCSCTDAWLTFTEVDLCGQPLDAPLSFEVRINLRTGRERRPRKRSAEVHALVREFLVRFPAERFQEMVERRHELRGITQRLEEYTVDASKMGELLCYSDVISEEGGMGSNGRRFSFFFTHEGRDFLIEDHYCPRPGCDCRQVHVEFWEHIELPGRSRRVDVLQRLMAIITLEGKLDQIQFSHEERQAAEELSRAWIENCGYQLDEFRRRYEQIKAIGRRSLASQPTASLSNAVADVVASRILPEPSKTRPIRRVRVGRNEPCPCGSGKKFKRCCARREVGG